MIALLLAALVSLVPPQADSITDRIVVSLLERLESTGAARLHRVAIGPSGALALPRLPEDAGGRYLVLRRDSKPGEIRYRRIERLEAERIHLFLDGQEALSMADGDLLRLDGDMRTFALQVSCPDYPSALLASSLAGALGAALDKTGIYRTVEMKAGSGADETVSSIALERIRASLLGQGIGALLRVTVAARGDRIVVICRLVGAEEGDDGVFSFQMPLSPELALLLRDAPGRPRGEPARLLMSMPLPPGALDCEAVELDGAPGEEIAVLYTTELLIFKLQDGSPGSFRGVPLESAAPAPFRTRIPTGKIIPGDLDGDGRCELLLACNDWAGGMLVRLAPRMETKRIPLQPVALTTIRGEAAVLGGNYHPGEDTFNERLLIADSGLEVIGSLPLADVRALEGLDREGNRYALLSATGCLFLWDRVGGAAPVRVDLGRVVALEAATAGRPKPEFLVAALDSTREGSTVLLVGGGATGETRTLLHTPLDIVSIAAYNSPAGGISAAVLLGKSDTGTTLEIYGLASSDDRNGYPWLPETETRAR